MVNPLLGQNMGRWAEVYFTSPPEKREEAVLNLLRELQKNAARPPANSGTQSEVLPRGRGVEQRPLLNFTPADQMLGRKQEFVRCQSCGTNNPVDQKFCGQCGLLLSGEPEAESAQPNWPSQAPAWNEPASFSSRESHEPSSDEGTKAFLESGSEAETRSPYDIPRELRWLRDVDAPKLMPAYEPVPYRYRIYVGAALAVLIGALVYVAWRGIEGPSGDSHALPQAVPGATKQPPAQSQISPPPVAASPAPGGFESDKANVAVPADNKAPDRAVGHAATRMDPMTKIKSETERKNASDLAPASPRGAGEQPATTASLEENGGRELAVAEGYLKSTQGKTRDSTEAAKWLWQAVRKQNAAATLILSDLYLRGDGVPKSCDQGRLLLNAAARKGAPGAGERIRNLQAFGCQ